MRQSAIDSFHAEFHGPVYLSVQTEAQLDLYNTPDLTKPCNFYVDPPSKEKPPLCRITQEGKEPIVTTDFYFANMEPKQLIPPTPGQQKDTPPASGAAASADK